MPLTFMASRKPDITLTTTLALRKGLNVTANAGTPQLPTPTGPVVAPPLDPQTASPLFSLPPELRNRIYDHMFAPVEVTLVDGEPLPIGLDTLTIVTPFDALLRTCLRAKQEIQGIFDRSPANSRFWESGDKTALYSTWTVAGIISSLVWRKETNMVLSVTPMNPISTTPSSRNPWRTGPTPPTSTRS